MSTKGISPEPSEYLDSGFNPSDFSEPEQPSHRLNQIPNFEDAFFLLPGSQNSTKPITGFLKTPSEMTRPTHVSKDTATSKLTRHKAYAIYRFCIWNF